MQRAFVTGGSGFIGGQLIGRLVREGTRVRALARSPAARERVASLGAEPVHGDLADTAGMAAAMASCEHVFHCAADMQDWDVETAFRVNVVGTRAVLAAARSAGVRRVVYPSGIGVTVGDGPAVDVDEERPPGRPVGALCATRIQSETEVRAASGAALETVVVRFPYVWGPGDTTIRPALVRAVRSGRFRWVGGGRHLISICHVDNAVQGLLLAAGRGRPGAVYWIADDERVELRAFVEALLAVDGLSAPDRSVPPVVARALADSLFWLGRVFKARQFTPLTPTTVRFVGQRITVDTRRARVELGYEPLACWPERLSELGPLARDGAPSASGTAPVSPAYGGSRAT